MNTYTPSLLRRWAAGKKINKSQLNELISDGYIYTTEDGRHLATTRGVELMNTRKDRH